MASTTNFCWKYDDRAWWYSTTKVKAKNVKNTFFHLTFIVLNISIIQFTYVDSTQAIFNSYDNGS